MSGEGHSNLGGSYYIVTWSRFTISESSLASVPGLPHSVRVLIMRRRQTFEATHN